MFIFLSTPFDMRDFCYFKPNHSLILLKTLFLIKKHLMLYCSLLSMKKQLFLNEFILVFIPVFHEVGNIVKKMSKVEGVQKKISYRGGGGGGVGCLQKGGFKFLHTMRKICCKITEAEI